VDEPLLVVPCLRSEEGPVTPCSLLAGRRPARPRPSDAWRTWLLCQGGNGTPCPSALPEPSD